jgi:signal transduction histidine kinase
VQILYEPADALLDVRLPQDLEVALYRAAQEGITNSLKHAGPESIRVSLERCENGIELAVADHAPQRRTPAKATDADVGSAGYGLVGIRQRLTPWQGAVNLERGPGCTVLRIFVPVDVTANRSADEA